MKPESPKTVSRFFLILAATRGLTFADGLEAADQGVATSCINIIFIGDSITAGTGVPDATQQSAPVVAVRDLQKKLGVGVTVSFSDQGHPGHTTVDFLPGGNDFALVEKAVIDLESKHAGPSLFSIMLGTNDSANSGPNGAPVSAADYSRNLKKIIDKLLADFPQSKFVINHPTWYSPNTHNGSDYEGDSAANRLKSYFPAVADLVADYESSHPGQVFVGDTQAYAYFASHRDELNGEPGKDGVFYLHPNVKGAESLGQFWAAALMKEMEP
jgi:lysophospholipase L1-like esterase